MLEEDGDDEAISVLNFTLDKILEYRDE